MDDDHIVSGLPAGTRTEERANALDGRPCILLAEHDAGIGRLHYTNLAQVGFDVVAVNSGYAALEACARYKNLAVAVLDFDLPDLNGLQALSRIRSECKQASTIVTTSKGSLTSAVNVMRAGAFDYLIKPISPERLVAAVCAAAQKQTHASSIERLPADDDVRILGSSAVMADVSRIIRSAASSKAAVFITGESGTGKEVCAELIHCGSARAKKPFIAFNCSALPRDLIESEIFGHVKGRLRAPSMTGRGPRSSRMADHCSWTRYAKWICPCRQNCCDFCRTGKCVAWAPATKKRWTSGSFAPPTVIR